MNPEANVAQQDLAGEVQAATRTIPWTETLYWCVRRELWEHRAIYIGPVAAAGVYLSGFLLTLHRLPHQMRDALADPSKMKALGAPYEFASVAVMLVAMIVEIFYCVDALQGRTQRSQHLVLEVAAGFRHDYGPFQSKHSVCDLAGAGLRRSDCDRVRDAGAEQRGADGKRIECRAALDAAIARAKCVWTALPHGDRAHSLVRADLLLDAADFRLGAARRTGLGYLAAFLCGHAGKGGVQHHAFRQWIRYRVSGRNGERNKGLG